METFKRWRDRFRARLPHYALTRWLFLRLFGLIYFMAFASAAAQILGLVGSHGILPVDTYVAAVRARGVDFLQFPTLALFNSSDGFLIFLTAGGAAFSLLVILDIGTAPVLLVLWIFYLSIVIAGQDFMSFQWDFLLLEAGFLAIFFAPWHLLPSRSQQSEPSLLIIGLYRLVIFRLMFSSGVEKLTSYDPAWHDLTALSYHYETQPLPSPLAWYMAKSPAWFLELSTALTLMIEICAPLLYFFPRRVRIIATGLTIMLQILIILTGNFTFFNYLTIVLCVPLFDDAFFRRFLPKRWLSADVPRSDSIPTLAGTLVHAVHQFSIVVITILILIANFVLLVRLYPNTTDVPQPAIAVLDQLAPYGIVNEYGLFTVMTTSRPEIIVEGSNDGQTWLPYEFKYKPDTVTKPLQCVAPYQPRLDWQMWFAALDNYGNYGWFKNFMDRLLEGSPDVLALMGKNPFPETPPRYVRAMFYNYHFSDEATREQTGAIWQREPNGVYFEQTSLAGH